MGPRFAAPWKWPIISLCRTEPVRRDFLKMIQRMVAESALPGTALGGRGTAGATGAAREFLAELSLREFALCRASTFGRCLESATDALRRRLPRGAQDWGIARRAMNLFLRDALYNAYLREQYRLHRTERWLELPLDAAAATYLRDADPAASLPAWRGIRQLMPTQNAAWQGIASAVAQQMGLARVHLDLYLQLAPRRERRAT